ncbi:hypothetical protein DYY66_0623 [Candidatus Nitrosotalea sp. FS]|uniref:hypothetical protein n=1 Tax=Candidatus Nitrosotalea sp. FS TaxID=2341021 RepID=UPI00140C813E|nr:hypothetical protein [Candidatus Nitrosotalea sp. FS]NHH97259.1 hypothetical protein [Candidatus Nitrosotalea sp. FS]
MLGDIIGTVGEFQLKKKSQYFAVLVESIISQQLATGAADAIFKRFKALYPKFPTAAEGSCHKKIQTSYSWLVWHEGRVPKGPGKTCGDWKTGHESNLKDG